ncbi:MAG: hypothetical protein KDD25_05500, partial [Bdellovibrionales bacterium]|nr:hypothetical protein [Bdellovibrionales bacterium]
SKNDPFVGGFQRTGTVPFNNLQCYEFMDPQGYVYVCGQPSGNNFEGIFIFENNNNADGVLGRFRGNQCLLTGGCS